MALPPNYFTCTLGEAAHIKAADPSSKSFQTVNELIDHQARLFPTHPAVACPVPPTKANDPWGSVVYSFEQLRHASIAIAPFLSKGEGPLVPENTCVALLWPSSLEFLLAWLALIRAGYSVLLIAPQCQPEAIARLCDTCNTVFLLHHQSFKKLAQSAVQCSSSLPRKSHKWRLSKTRIHRLIQAATPIDSATTFRIPKPEDIAYIHHTSGTSTGFPKPVSITHQGAVRVLPSLPPSSHATFTTTPLYHGGIADCFRAWASSELIWLFPGAEMPITAKNIVSSLYATQPGPSNLKVKYFSSVPYVLQMMAEDAAGMKWLKRMDIVGVGGASLPESTGNSLVQQGVKLISRLGSTECGFLLSSHRDYEVDFEWQYLRAPVTSPYLEFERQNDDSGLSELIVRSGWPYLAKTNRENGSFATSDLFQPHETIQRGWKYHSRSDSQITLITGKKFDPSPLEDIVASLPEITDALVFGNGREVPGILVFVKENASPNIEEKIWLTAIDVSNKKGQAHMRIERHMVRILRQGALMKSSKGTTLRGLAEKTFEKEIEIAYSLAAAVDMNLQRDGANVKEIVKHVLESVLGRKFGNEDDFYSHGVDSASCTRIRALLEQYFPRENQKLPWNVVYDCGNLDRLSHYMVSSVSDKHKSGLDDLTIPAIPSAEMLQTALEFSNFQNIPKGSFLIHNAVLLTGATGALGGHILAVLLRTECVSRVYCLVRAKSNDLARERVLKNLEDRLLIGAYLINTGKLYCLASELHAERLGLEDDTYQFLVDNTILVIHAAWPVNFSISLTAFKDSFQGLHNLLELKIRDWSHISRRPTFVFCSSTASVIKSPRRPIPEEISTSPTDASTIAYSSSKWIAEAICTAAHKCHPSHPAIHMKIARMGQLTGDTHHGIWNTKEAYPLIMSTLEKVGCLPALDDRLDWLPFDTAAKIVVDIAFSNGLRQRVTEANPVEVYHVVNKYAAKTFKDLASWSMEMPGKENFSVVEPDVWMDKLESLEGEHPAKALLGLWREAYGKKKETEGDCGGVSETVQTERVFETVKTEKVSDAMWSVKEVDRELVSKIWEWLERTLHGGA